MLEGEYDDPLARLRANVRVEAQHRLGEDISHDRFQQWSPSFEQLLSDLFDQVPASFSSFDFRELVFGRS